jgi:signal transduction histidine kinase
MARPTRVERLFLYHLWACLPFALAWTLWPTLVGATHEPAIIHAMRWVYAVGFVYLAARTWLTYHPWGNVRWDYVWPVLDVVLISVGLRVMESTPGSWAVLLYLLPVTEAAARLNLGWALLVGGLAAAGYVLASAPDEQEWLRHSSGLFRPFFLVLMASLLAQLGREVARARREAAVADYKNRLAAEIHDGIQQSLGGIAQRLELARALIPTDPEQAARVAVDQRHLARQVADELRVLVRRLRSPLLEEEGLAEALRQHLALIGQRDRVATHLEVRGDPVWLGTSTEQQLLRIVQEALTNIVKHAGAGRVEVCLEYHPRQVHCSVHDDGRGFNPEQLPGEPGLAGGFGMHTMRARVATLNGTCAVTSGPGQGTTVTVKIPHHEKPAAPRFSYRAVRRWWVRRRAAPRRGPAGT